MGLVLLGADGPFSVCEVPEVVARNLEDYCLEFCCWLSKSPQAAPYRRLVNGVSCLCYNEADFIDYLNRWRFPEETSVLVEVLSDQDIPSAYRNLPRFNF